MSKKRQFPGVPPAYILSKHPDYRSVFCSGIFGGLSPNDGQIIVYIDRYETEMDKDRPGTQRLSHVNREFQVELHMAPLQFKSIALWMNWKIQEYENNFGEIQTAPKSKEDMPPSGMIT